MSPFRSGKRADACFALKHVAIKVRNNGIGIPDAIKAKIMQPFFNTKPTGEGLFAKPYINDVFDFSKSEFFDELYSFGERISKMSEFKQPRGVKHFIYISRTNFGLYNILHDLTAKVNTNSYCPHVLLDDV